VFDSEFERGLFDLRKSKLEEIGEAGTGGLSQSVPCHPHRSAVRERWVNAAAEDLEANRTTVAVAGRIMAIRAQGKAGLQRCSRVASGCRFMFVSMRWAAGFALYKLLDLGDHIGVSGTFSARGRAS